MHTLLRHTAAVLMAENGVPMSEISQYLGHNSTETTERVYARYSPDYLRKAAAEVGEREALRLEVAVALAGAHDEVDERLIGAASVDGERGDARADDDGKGEEALSDDLAERLEAPDPFTDALEPAVRAQGVEREMFL
jgi:hypothetical protein